MTLSKSLCLASLYMNFLNLFYLLKRYRERSHSMPLYSRRRSRSGSFYLIKPTSRKISLIACSSKSSTSSTQSSYFLRLAFSMLMVNCTFAPIFLSLRTFSFSTRRWRLSASILQISSRSPSSSSSSAKKPSSRIAKNRFSNMKFPMKIQDTQQITGAKSPIFSDLIESNSTEFQFSVVSTQKTVKNAIMNSSQLPRGFPSAKLNWPPKICIPSSV